MHGLLGNNYVKSEEEQKNERSVQKDIKCELRQEHENLP